MRGYFASPAKSTGKLPGVVVIHENRGLNPYIEDVARRLAVENFLAKQVREGKMSLAEAQKGIATDWTQFLAASEGCEGAACE